MSTPETPREETLEERMARNRVEPFIYIATEIDHATCNHIAIHEIQLPPYLSPKSYQPILSMEAFRNGKRKGASKQDQAHYRDRCCWGPKALYKVDSLEEWTRNCEWTTKSMRSVIPDYPDPREQPRIVHKCLADFYAAIGFDKKLRGYRDKDGNEIKYTVLKEPLKLKKDQPGPEMA